MTALKFSFPLVLNKDGWSPEQLGETVYNVEREMLRCRALCRETTMIFLIFDLFFSFFFSFIFAVFGCCGHRCHGLFI